VEVPPLRKARSAYGDPAAKSAKHTETTALKILYRQSEHVDRHQKSSKDNMKTKHKSSAINNESLNGDGGEEEEEEEEEEEDLPTYEEFSVNNFIIYDHEYEKANLYELQELAQVKERFWDGTVSNCGSSLDCQKV